MPFSYSDCIANIRYIRVYFCGCISLYKLDRYFIILGAPTLVISLSSIFVKIKFYMIVIYLFSTKTVNRQYGKILLANCSDVSNLHCFPVSSYPHSNTYKPYLEMCSESSNYLIDNAFE